MQDKMIEKIRKLLSLGEGNENKAEAEAAYQKAVALMTEHNIEMSRVRSVSGVKQDYIRGWVEQMGKAPMEQRYAVDIIQKFFFVSVVASIVDGMSILNFIGTKENVDTAIFIFNNFQAQMYVLWQKYKMDTGASTKEKQSYYYGLWQGFTAKLQEERTSTEQKYGLVLVDDPDLHKAVSEYFPRLTKNKGQRVNISSDNARNAGYDAGRNMNINKGVGTNNNKRIS